MTGILDAVAGGVLLGLSAAGLLLAFGRVFGVSGILAGALQPWRGKDGVWRVAVVLGLLVGGLLLRLMRPESFDVGPSASPLALAAAGLLVGVGTRMGGGCTSGHGLCGVARLSPRSIAATLTFMAAGMVVVWVVRHAL